MQKQTEETKGFLIFLYFFFFSITDRAGGAADRDGKERFSTYAGVWALLHEVALFLLRSLSPGFCSSSASVSRFHLRLFLRVWIKCGSSNKIPNVHSAYRERLTPS